MNTMYSREASLRKKRQEMAAAKKRRNIVGMVAVALVFVLTVGGTVAFLVSQTLEVANTFTPASVKTEIKETFDGTIKSDVRIENESDISVYVRAKIIINWVDPEGNVATSAPEGYSYEITNSDGNTVTDISELLSSGKWVLGNDGFWYYKVPLTANDGLETVGTDQTSDLFKSIKVTKDGDDYDLSVQILTEAIQADGKTPAGVPAVTDAWGVTINSDSSDNIDDGTLVIAS